MPELSHFYIDFAAVPTAWNPTQTISRETLVDTLVRDGKKLRFSQAMFGGREHVVLKVYRDVGDTREVLYEDRFYNNPHFSPQLDTMINREIKEKYV